MKKNSKPKTTVKEQLIKNTASYKHHQIFKKKKIFFFLKMLENNVIVKVLDSD